jgi:hypothetical protein
VSGNRGAGDETLFVRQPPEPMLTIATYKDGAPFDLNLAFDSGRIVGAPSQAFDVMRPVTLRPLDSVVWFGEATEHPGSQCVGGAARHSGGPLASTKLTS